MLGLFKLYEGEAMSAKNDITGDSIASKANSKLYRDNYEKIFAKKASEKRIELDEWIHPTKTDDRSGKIKF